MKFSSHVDLQSRPSFFRDVVATIDEAYAAEVEEFEQRLVDGYVDGESWTSREVRSWFWDQYGEQLGEQYQTLVEFFDMHEAELLAAYSDNSEIPLVARQTAWSTVQQITYNLDFYPQQVNTARMSTIRDSAMAVNVEFLLEKLYPDKKIVTWAHNVHIRHNDAEVEGCSSCQAQPVRPDRMGTWLARWFRPDLYTVGLYMNRGSAAWNSREVYTIEPAASNTMEGILSDAGLPYLFADLLHQARDDGNSWMFESVVARDWGVNDERLVPRDQYDAILFIEEVHPPNYIN
jgi:erythromycin esterase